MEEIIAGFPDIEAWRRFVEAKPFLRSKEYIRKIVKYGLTNGVSSAFFGKIGADEVSVAGPNFRESFLARGNNPRCRAVLELVAGEPWFRDPGSARIYAAEAFTPFALAMRGRFPRFIGSEYVSDETGKQALYPIEFQDLTQLTLLSNTFDCVITNDCLEHVPDIPRCLEELCRVLRPNGIMLSTFPFTFSQTSVIKARLIDGVVHYLTEPEYHDNPIEPGKGSLVFEIPGWQILHSARQVGFARCEMVFVSSIERGITATEIAGIWVLRCYK